MTDTNAIPQIISATPQQVVSAINAWTVVAGLVCGILVHAYHTVVNGGGIKRIWSNFWNGKAPTQTP